MTKATIGAVLLALAFLTPVPADAGVDVGISINLPLPIAFVAPPEVIVIPGTYVYVVPDIGEELFFYDGWWWRPWEGRWYRSRHYDSGWVLYRRIPVFYSWIPPGWRDGYRDHRWEGRPWEYERVPARKLRGNWKNWETKRYWEKRQNWGVRGWNPPARPGQPSRDARPAPPGRTPGREGIGPPPDRSRPRDVRPQQSGPPPRENRPPQPRPQLREGRPPQPAPQSREIRPERGEGPRGRDDGPGRPARGGEGDRGVR